MLAGEEVYYEQLKKFVDKIIEILPGQSAALQLNNCVYKNTEYLLKLEITEQQLQTLLEKNILQESDIAEPEEVYTGTLQHVKFSDSTCNVS